MDEKFLAVQFYVATDSFKVLGVFGTWKEAVALCAEYWLSEDENSTITTVKTPTQLLEELMDMYWKM